jgi:alkyl hydroperoxide reductase subunit F
MLDETLKAQLRGYLALLSRPVEIESATDGSDRSREMQELIAEIVTLSPLVTHVPARSAAPFTPSFALRLPGREPHVRFAGLPMGHEFTSLVLALLQAGGHPPKAEPELIERIARLEQDLDFETVVSLSCQSCPEVVQALNLMALKNPRIRHTMIDGAASPAEVECRQVLAVPAVFLNGKPFGQGRMDLAEILSKIDSGGAREAAALEAAALAARAPYDVLIVGGGPAGAAAAIYSARKGIRTGLLAERLGGQLLDTVGIENFISVTETEGHKLASGLEQHVTTYEVDVMNGQRAQALRPGLSPGNLIEVELENGAALKARSLVIATGARWREINVPGEREYRNRGVAYCPHCDGPLYKGRKVAVIGGGNSGVEAAIDLAGLVSHVTLLEYESALRADAVLVRKLQSLPNVTVLTGARTTEVKGDGQRVIGLAYEERASGALRELELAGVFVQIGLAPNTDWLKGVLALTPRGEIEVDARGQTSVPGIFAAGDCTIVPYKQIVIAMGEGAKAALGAFDHLIRAPLRAAA